MTERNPAVDRVVGTVQESLAAVTTDRCVVRAEHTGEGWRFAATVVHSDSTATTTSVTVSDNDVASDATPQHVACTLGRNLGVNIAAAADAALQTQFNDPGYTAASKDVVEAWKRIAFASTRTALIELADHGTDRQLADWARLEIRDLRVWAQHPSSDLSVYRRGRVNRKIVGPLATAHETVGWYRRQTKTAELVSIATFLADKLETALNASLGEGRGT